MSSFIKNIKHAAIFSGRTGGIIGLVSGFVGDFLLPIAPVGIYVSIAAVLALISTGIIYAIVPKSSADNFFEQHELMGLRTIWFFPMASALALLAIISFSAHQYSSNFSDDNGGVIGTISPEIKEIQRGVGILEDLHDTTTQMVSEQRETNKKLSTSVELQRNISGNTQRIAQQQELSNRAVVWNQKTLQDALVRGDLEMLKMFHNAGHNLSQVQHSSSASPLSLPMIIIAVRNNHTNIDDVLKLLIKHNYLDTRELYSSRSGFTAPEIDALWQKMELQELCQEYSAREVGYHEFQASMLKRGYLVPDDLAKRYGPTKYGTKCQFIGGPSIIKTTLFIEAIYADNKLAIDYLESQPGANKNGYIELTYGARIVLRPGIISNS